MQLLNYSLAQASVQCLSSDYTVLDCFLCLRFTATGAEQYTDTKQHAGTDRLRERERERERNTSR